MTENAGMSSNLHFAVAIILDVLKPSLPAPSTCNIIDVNPGACLWSQALHDAVKPLRHILVESDPKRFGPALAPLLNSGASYEYAESLPTVLSPKHKLYADLEKEVDANEQLAPRNDVHIKHNERLVVTANLSGRFVKRGGYQGTITKNFMEQYYRSLVSRGPFSGLHQRGLVKLLAWIPEKDKYALIPRSVIARTPQSIRLEASCHIREICSSYPYSDTVSLYRRWYNADRENADQVATTQKSLGLTVPEDRLQPLPEPPSTSLAPTLENLPLLAQLEMRPLLIDEMMALNEHLRETDPEWHENYWKWKPKKGRAARHEVGQRPVYSFPDKENYNLLLRRLRTTHNGYKRVESMVNLRRALQDRVVEIANQYGSSSDIYREKLSEIEAQLSMLRQATAKLFKDSRHAVEKALDDYRVMGQQPPTLAWNDRKFEPILCKPSDFYPNTPMSLFEFTPKIEYIQAIDTAEKQVCFDYVVFCLDWEKGSPLSVALKRLVGEDYENFIVKLPDLLDPAKGGWYNLEHITPRTLPTALLMKIALAFDKWAFRPSITQMLSTLSAQGRAQKTRFH